MLLVSRSGRSFSSACVQLCTKSVVLSPPFSLCEETHWTAATVILFCWIDSWSGCNSKFREWPGSQGPVEVTTFGGLTVPEDIEPHNPYPSLILVEYCVISPLHTTSLRFECSEEVLSGKICCEPSVPCYLLVGYQHCGLTFDCLCFLFVKISSRLDCIICAVACKSILTPFTFTHFATLWPQTVIYLFRISHERPTQTDVQFWPGKKNIWFYSLIYIFFTNKKTEKCGVAVLTPELQWPIYGVWRLSKTRIPDSNYSYLKC